MCLIEYSENLCNDDTCRARLCLRDADDRRQAQRRDLLRGVRDAGDPEAAGGGSPVKDAFDPREFRIWVTFDESGTVRASHAFESSVEDPLPGAVDVTTLAPAQFTGVWINPALLTLQSVAQDALLQQLAATALARAHMRQATADVVSAIAQSLAGGQM